MRGMAEMRLYDTNHLCGCGGSVVTQDEGTAALARKARSAKTSIISKSPISTNEETEVFEALVGSSAKGKRKHNLIPAGVVLSIGICGGPGKHKRHPA